MDFQRMNKTARRQLINFKRVIAVLYQQGRPPTRRSEPPLRPLDEGWSAQQLQSPNKLLSMRQAMGVAGTHFGDLKATATQLITTDPLHYALELSLLRKLDPAQHEVLRTLTLQMQHTWRGRRGAGVDALRLCLEHHDGLAENDYERLSQVFEKLPPWQLAKVFRFPAFKRNAALLADYVAHVRETGPGQLSAKGCFNLLVLYYAIGDHAGFDALTRQIALRFEGTSRNVPTDPESAVATVTRAFISRADAEHPVVPKTDRRPRIAVCVSGQLRGYDEARRSWSHLHLDGCVVDFYVHTWQSVGRRLPSSEVVESSRRVFESRAFSDEFFACCKDFGESELQTRYPLLYEHLMDSDRVTDANLRAAYGPTAVVCIEDDSRLPFSDYSNPKKMHYKIHAAHQLVVRKLDSYDLVIRLRPDKQFLESPAPSVPWLKIADRSRREGVLFCEEPTGLRENLVIGDQLAIGCPDLMNEYARAWTQLETNPNFYGVPRSFSGHSTLAYTCFFAGIRTERVPHLRPGRLVDPHKVSSDTLHRLLEEDIDNRCGALLDSDCRLQAALSK